MTSRPLVNLRVGANWIRDIVHYFVYEKTKNDKVKRNYPNSLENQDIIEQIAWKLYKLNFCSDQYDFELAT